MRISELKKIIDSVYNEDDDDVEVVIFVASDYSDNATVVSFEKVNVTDCRAELVPNKKLRLF